MRIVIDPGHAGGRTDPGAVNTELGLQEADIALAVSKTLGVYLEAVGFEVMLTRLRSEDTKTDDLSLRTEFANSHAADLFISLHCNAAENKQANGFEVWTSPGVTTSDKLATCIFKQIENTFPDMYGRADYSDGDPDKESKFYVLMATNMPAVLVEMGFISNNDEALLLNDPAWQNEMARAIARGVTDFCK